MAKQTGDDNLPTLVEAMPTANIAERWVLLLEAIREEESAEKRERQFQYAHGYLRALVDAELLADAVLPQLRDLLIKAAAGHG